MTRTVTFPYHPEYGLHDSTREAAVLYALDHGTASAAVEFNVSRRSIQKWLRDATIVETPR